MKIYSKLPFGLLLEDPINPKVRVEIKGTNTATVIGATTNVTEVDKTFWETWKAVNKDYQPYMTGAIFEGSDNGEKTGLEPLEPDAFGVEPADVK